MDKEQAVAWLEKAKEAIHQYEWSDLNDYEKAIDGIIELIIKGAEPKPLGKWKLVCCHCGADAPWLPIAREQYPTNFCPTCGAHMYKERFLQENDNIKGAL